MIQDPEIKKALEDQIDSIVDPLVLKLIHNAKEGGLIRGDFNYIKALAIGEVKKIYDEVKNAINQDPERFKLKQMREAATTGLMECYNVAREKFDRDGVNEKPNGDDAGAPTLARDARVVPVEKELINSVLDPAVLFGSAIYLTESTREMLENVFRMMINQYFDMVMEKTIMSLETSMGIALEKLWGKPLEDVTLNDIDLVLKSETKLPQED